MEQVRSVSSNNRVISMRKFVGAPPRRGSVLRLVTCEDPPQTIGEWQREECENNGARAEEIDDYLSDHRDACERDVKAILAWIAEDGTSVSSKRLHCRLEPREDQPEALTALGIDGTERGLLMQVQQHLHVVVGDMHAMQKSLLAAMQTQATMNQGLVQQLGDMLQAAYADKHALHEQVGELAAELKAGPDAEEKGDGEESAEGEARAELMKTVNGALQQALPMIAMKVIAGGKE